LQAQETGGTTKEKRLVLNAQAAFGRVYKWQNT